MIKTSKTTINVRVDKNTKKKAQEALSEMGLDLSAGINMFLSNIVITKSVPLELRTKNGFTIAQEKKILKETEDALKNGKSYSSIEELHDDILNSK